MKIRRYTCKDMQEALLKVKMDLGSEAVIMSSRKVRPKGLKGLFSKPMIEVVAAIDDDYVRPAKPKYQPLQSQFQQQFQAQYQPQSQTQVQPQPQPQVPPQYQAQMQPQPQLQYQPQQQVPVAQAPVNEQAYVMQNQAIQAGTKAADAAPTSGVTEEKGNDPEDRKIAELEEKVKSMETMLNRIYEAVQKNEPPGDRESMPGNTIREAENEAQVKGKTETPVKVSSDALISLRDMLFEKDVEPKLIEKILDKIRERGGNSMGREEVFNLASRVMTVLLGEPEPILLPEQKKPYVVIFIGPTGVGKTTTLAKIAADFTFRQKKVGLITADTYRIAAVEQLKTYAEILNLKVTVVYSPGEIKEAVERLSDNDLILIDTAGRSHKNKEHFDELKALVSAVNADETYLVISCNTSRIAVREILEHYAFIRNYKLLFTKLDETPSPGVILNARYMTGKPLSYTTAGQSVPDDLDIANVRQLVSSILNGGF